jgi:acetate kinase
VSLSLLALNVGSASLKAASYLLSRDTGTRETGRIAVDDFRMDDVRDASPMPVSGPVALLSSVMAQLPSLREPDRVVHRIVHGGDRSSPLELTATVLDELDALTSLAPVHQPPALALARAAMQRWPRARHYAAFDTSWHLSMPEQYRVLPLPFSLYAQGVKHYGFHGLAFQSAMRQLVQLAPERANGRIVLAHLGGGSSLCAVRNGRCVNTTMGMTPLGGIAMSTRPGSLDPGVILHLQRNLGIPPADLDRMLWKESGLKGLSGESGDMRALLASPTEYAHRAIEVYVGGVVQGIAAMAASIGGLDILVFSGGIGMHAPVIRSSVVDALDWLGLGIENGLNQHSRAEISRTGAQVRTFVLHVDEEFEMADSVARLAA